MSRHEPERQAMQDELDDIKRRLGRETTAATANERDLSPQALDRFTPGPEDDPETFGFRETEGETLGRQLRSQRGIDERYGQAIDLSQVRYAGDLKNIALAEAVRNPKKDTTLQVEKIKAIGKALEAELDPVERQKLLNQLIAFGSGEAGKVKAITPPSGFARFKKGGKTITRVLSPSGELYDPQELANELMTLKPNKRKQALGLLQKTLPQKQYDAITKIVGSFKKGRGTGKLHDRTRSVGRDFGLRPDKTRKGSGFLGTLRRPDGKVSTELSVGVTFDGRETLIPLLVPTLTQSEIDFLLSSKGSKGGEKIPKAIFDKAVAHARKRIRQGKSPFIEAGERPPRRSLTTSSYGLIGRGVEERRKKALPGAKEELKRTYAPIYDIIKRRPIRK